jgi:hypothetical protein
MYNSFLYVVACGMAATFTGWELPDPVSSIHHVLYSHTHTLVLQFILSEYLLHANSKELYKKNNHKIMV